MTFPELNIEFAEDGASTLGPPTNASSSGEQEQVAHIRFVAYAVVSPIIISIGFVGNFLTILLLRLPQFRGVTYMYFLSLALSDLFSLALCVSVISHLNHESTLVYSTAVWFSYLELFFVNVPMSTSVFIVVCVTVERFYSVCRPTHFMKIHTEHFAVRAIASSIALAVLLWLPICFLKHPVQCELCTSPGCVPPDNRTWWVACVNNEVFPEDWYYRYSWIRQAFVAFIPIILLIVLNTLTMRGFMKLNARRKNMERNSISVTISASGSSGLEGRHRKEQHLITLLAAVMITFFVTMLPSGILNAVYTEKPEDRLKYEVFRAVGNNLEILSHALNFYMYILCSGPIRAAVKDILRGRRQIFPFSVSRAFEKWKCKRKTASAESSGDSTLDGTKREQIPDSGGFKEALDEGMVSDPVTCGTAPSIVSPAMCEEGIS